MTRKDALTEALGVFTALGLGPGMVSIMPATSDTIVARVPLPKNAKPGHYLFTLVACDRELIVTPPVGWTLASLDHVKDRFDLYVYEKVMQPGERDVAVLLSERATIAAACVAVTEESIHKLVMAKAAADDH